MSGFEILVDEGDWGRFKCPCGTTFDSMAGTEDNCRQIFKATGEFHYLTPECPGCKSIDVNGRLIQMEVNSEYIIYLKADYA